MKTPHGNPRVTCARRDCIHRILQALPVNSNKKFHFAAQLAQFQLFWHFMCLHSQNFLWGIRKLDVENYDGKSNA